MIMAQIEGARPVRTSHEAWVISACQSLPARIKNSVAKLGIKYSGDLQYVTAQELTRQGGISVGAVSALASMCGAWGVVLGSKAAPPVQFAADVADKLPAPATPEAVNHPSHYTPGPFEVYKVLAHFNIMHGFVQQAIIYLARAHRKGSYDQDVAKAAKWIEFTMETGAGMGDHINRTSYGVMDGHSLRDIAILHWYTTEKIADVIEVLGSPWTISITDKAKAEGRIGENLSHYTPRLWQAWRMLTATPAK